MKKELIMMGILLFSMTFVFADVNNENNPIENEISKMLENRELLIDSNDSVLGDTNMRIHVEDSNTKIDIGTTSKIISTRIQDRIRNVTNYAAQEMNEIRKQYQEKFVNAVRDGNKELKNEIADIRKAVATKVGQIIKESKDLNYEQFEGFGQTLRVNLNSITIEDNETQDKNRLNNRSNISVRVKNKLIEIRNTNNKIEIIDGNISVESEEEIEIDENGIKIKNKRVNVLPSRIQEKLKEKAQFKLNVNDQNQIQYQFDANNTRNLFGLIPLQAQERIKINAETGKIESYERPWWSFLAFGQDVIVEDQTLIN